MAGDPPRTKKALLFVNPRKENALSMAEEIRRELESRRIKVISHSAVDNFEFCPEKQPDVAFSLGGDGTVLYAARALASAGAPIFPVNLGTLGFIAAVKKEEWLSVFESWLAGRAKVSLRTMLKISAERRGGAPSQNICLNDAVVSASGIAKLIRLRLETETAVGELTELGRYRADGLIIATPTGSTAYSMAAGGPILDPEMEALIINPICPFTLSNRPAVLPSQQRVVISVEEEQRSGVLLTVDGQITKNLEPGDRIIIEAAPFRAMLISSDRRSYYTALRTKLNWSGTYKGEGDA
ncbi:MAG: NAD(+)/NADH kinase [Treponema sp.]|jgi:NAD+ kinase|nr:NAD(+)/NADH kinase [Treponema sp.]